LRGSVDVYLYKSVCKLCNLGRTEL